MAVLKAQMREHRESPKMWGIIGLEKTIASQSWPVKDTIEKFLEQQRLIKTQSCRKNAIKGLAVTSIVKTSMD